MKGTRAQSLLGSILFALFFKGNLGARIKGQARQKVLTSEAVNETHADGSDHRRCKFWLTRPSDEEDTMLEKMMWVKRPHLLGKGGDVTRRDPNRPSYSKLKFISAWKVSNTPALTAYHENVEKLEAQKDNDTIPMTTDIGGVSLGNNEYLLLHGGEPEHVEYKMCKGPVSGGGVFGKGIYLADTADKMDQYTDGDVDAKYFKKLLKDAYDLHDDKVKPKKACVLCRSSITYGLVVRTYMGHHAEVQRDRYGRGGAWHWRDPKTGAKQETSSGQIPFASDGPLKAVATTQSKLGGLKPVWFNEYLVPSPLFAAVEYIVVYERAKK